MTQSCNGFDDEQQQRRAVGSSVVQVVSTRVIGYLCARVSVREVWAVVGVTAAGYIPFRTVLPSPIPAPFSPPSPSLLSIGLFLLSLSPLPPWLTPLPYPLRSLPWRRSKATAPSCSFPAARSRTGGDGFDAGGPPRPLPSLRLSAPPPPPPPPQPHRRPWMQFPVVMDLMPADPLNPFPLPRYPLPRPPALSAQLHAVPGVNNTAIFWGMKQYNDVLMPAGKGGNVQSEMLFAKTSEFTLEDGWVFPRKIVFNGEECVMPEDIPALPVKPAQRQSALLAAIFAGAAGLLALLMLA
ncbi:unnamed protein product [Closterium sp. NIES-53]